MRANLMVMEQINVILFGLSYQKKEDFFGSKRFEELIDCLTGGDNFDDILNGDSDNASINSSRADRKESHHDRNNDDNDDESIREYWASKIRNFLIKSNEKWLLDQFNLCKRFINQNSIEGDLKDFQHYVFDRFNSIRALKNKLFRKVLNKSVEPDKNRPTTKEGAIKEIAAENFVAEPITNDDDLKILKLDISALIKAIEEIENRIKMEKILTRNKKQKLKETVDNDEENRDRMIRQQFSMLNFNRNFIALNYAIENPSD